MGHARNIPKYKKEDVGKKNWKSDKCWGPGPQDNTSPRLFSAGSPNSSPSLPAFLHSPGLLSTALLSSPNFSFTLPSPFFGSLEEQGPVYLRLRTQPPSALSGETLAYLAELTL